MERQLRSDEITGPGFTIHDLRNSAKYAFLNIEAADIKGSVQFSLPVVSESWQPHGL